MKFCILKWTCSRFLPLNLHIGGFHLTSANTQQRNWPMFWQPQQKRRSEANQELLFSRMLWQNEQKYRKSEKKIFYLILMTSIQDAKKLSQLPQQYAVQANHHPEDHNDTNDCYSRIQFLQCTTNYLASQRYIVNSGKGRICTQTSDYSAGPCPGFCGMKWMGILLLPLDEMFVHSKGTL